jgi:hypothetical protein
LLRTNAIDFRGDRSFARRWVRHRRLRLKPSSLIVQVAPRDKGAPVQPSHAKIAAGLSREASRSDRSRQIPTAVLASWMFSRKARSL